MIERKKMIEQPGKKKMLLFSGSSNDELAQKVASNLGTLLSDVERKEFANGEIYLRIGESVRGADCFVMQSHSGDINRTIMEQLLMIDALKRASAKRITAVLPFYPYSRQDKKALPREPISARLISDMYVAAGVDRMVSLDLHTQQIQGFVDQPFEHLINHYHQDLQVYQLLIQYHGVYTGLLSFLQLGQSPARLHELLKIPVWKVSQKVLGNVLFSI